MSDDESHVAKLKVVELKEELKKRNLSYAGIKSVLAQRLLEAMAKEKEGSSNDEQVPVEDQDSTEGAEKDDEPEEPEAVNGGVEAANNSGEVVDQIVQTEAGGEEVSRIANLQEEARAVQEQEEESVSQEATDQDKMEAETTQPDVPEPTAQPDTVDPVPTIEQSEETAPESDPSPEDKETETEQSAQTKDPEVVEETSDTAPTEDGAEMEATKEEVKVQDAVKAEEKMDTDSTVTDKTESFTEATENTIPKSEDDSSQEKDSSVQLGVKRPRDEDEVKTPAPNKKQDPSNAPDPEEPEEFDEDQVLMEAEFTPPEDDSVITLDRYTSDIYFNIRSDGLGGCGLTEQGFARLWATARASWGVKGGKYFYEIKVDENMSVDLPDTEEHPHAIRVGWTVDEAQKGLGEEKYSYGYGGTGKSSTNNSFNDYGETYGPGDIIGCFVDLDSSPGTISFSKNGTHLGTAFELDESLSGKVLFPCVATKNVSFSLNFGGSPAWCEVTEVDGYSFVQEASEDHKARAPKGPTSPSECEVVMMIGLPACGKTTWAEKLCSDNPEKRYSILGTNLIMEKMKVSGLGRKHNYHGRWETLIKLATETLNKLFLLAPKNYRNYIIDQTNVYEGAQNRKMKYFDGYICKAEVVVPPHHELRRRTGLRNAEMGTPVPESAINAMKANFHIPKVGDLFTEVNFADIYGMAAEKIVRQYREDALGLPSYPQSKRGRYNDHRGGYRGGWSGPPRGGGYSPQFYNPPHRQPYRYGSPYGYQNRSPYPPYGQSSPPMYGSQRGGGGYGHRPQYRSPYSSPGQYRGGYGGGYRGPPPRRGGGGGYGGGYGRY